MLAVAAVVALGLAACSKDNGGNDDSGETTTLAIRVSGVSTTSNPNVRSVEEPGGPGQLQISNGTILITDASGDVVVHSVPLDYATASTTGQIINDIPASSANVYIVANATVVNGNMSAVFADVKSISSQSNYRNVALANDGGTPVAINIAPLGSTTPSTASVTLVPLISRVELHSIVGGENMADNTDDDYVKITGFTVEGVYLDSYYPGFTLNGMESGTLVSEGQDSGFAIGDIGPWAADAGTITATPSPDVWAHNVVAKGAPRFIVKLSNVTAEDGSGAPRSGTFFSPTIPLRLLRWQARLSGCR